MDTAERRVSRQLDIVHFIKNAITIEALAKLSLRKSDRYLIRRQPKVHLLNYNSSPSSSDTIDPIAYQSSNNLDIYRDSLPNYG